MRFCLAALGWPAEVPDHVSLAPLIRVRQAFDQYACVRPAKLFPGVRSPLADKRPEQIDIVVIRENSEGEYVDNGGRVRRGTPDEYAVQTAVHTRRGIERILRYGFALARRRRRHLTMVTKSNAQRHAYTLWDDILDELKPQFADVETERQHADAAAMNFVRQPERMDVVVASNLFGDLLTDLGGVISGGLGLAPSTNTNPERDFPSMFEPVHGSAPDIAGKGIANPIAAIFERGLDARSPRTIRRGNAHSHRRRTNARRRPQNARSGRATFDRADGGKNSRLRFDLMDTPDANSTDTTETRVTSRRFVDSERPVASKSSKGSPRPQSRKSLRAAAAAEHRPYVSLDNAQRNDHGAGTERFCGTWPSSNPNNGAFHVRRTGTR